MDTIIIYTKDQCASIKSRKNSNIRCPNPATAKGERVWCSVHNKSRIAWNQTPHIPKQVKPNLKAVQTIQRFWYRYGYKSLRKLLGPLIFCPNAAHNDKDIFSYDSIETIPLTYRFTVFDGAHYWLFDIRFLTQLLHHGNDMKNPFTQEAFATSVFERLQIRTQQLQRMKKPIVYADEELTSEQIWNQKVLDVFLKMTSLGYSVNITWFEGLHVRGQEMLYTELYRLWAPLIPEDRQRIVPGHDSGRSSLFRWHPSDIVHRGFDLKWWRKQTLRIMRTFLITAEGKDNQTCGCLYVLRALANVHPRAGEAFPWLVYENND
jgi:hypothetical protein